MSSFLSVLFVTTCQSVPAFRTVPASQTERNLGCEVGSPATVAEPTGLRLLCRRWRMTLPLALPFFGGILGGWTSAKSKPCGQTQTVKPSLTGFAYALCAS